MAELFWAYWDASIRFALLAAALLLLLPVLRRWLSPRLLCWAWAVLLLRLIFPLVVPFSGSIFNAHDSLRPSVWTNAIREGVVNSGFGETILPRLRDEDQLILNQIGFSWEGALLCVWSVGAILLAIKLTRDVRRLRLFFNGAELQSQGPLYELFKDLRHRYGINSNVPLLVSDKLDTPGIAGIFNPRVVLPRHCVEKLSEEELRCVLIHELTHYRRGDLFLHHGLLLVCYLHWYNPVVWLVMRQFKISVEEACDQEVLDSVCIGTAREYGLTLLQVLENSRSSNSSPVGALGLLGSGRKSDLANRIHLIVGSRYRNPWLGAVCLGLFGMSLGFSFTGENDPERESKRLLRLTRVAAPMAETRALAIADLVYGDGTSRVWLEHRGGLVRRWDRVMEPRRYWGKGAVFIAHVGSEGGAVAAELYVYTQDQYGRVLSYENVLKTVDTEGRDFFEGTVEIEVPDGARELHYGLKVEGPGRAWLDVVALHGAE